MKTILRLCCACLLPAAVAGGTTFFAAMRAEVSSIAAVGAETRVELQLQVAPEDRERLGRRVWIEGELRRGEGVTDRIARTAELDRQGRVVLELLWEPGTYELEVSLDAVNGAARGIWRGEIVVAELAGPASRPEPAPPEEAPRTSAEGEREAVAPAPVPEVTEPPVPAPEPVSEPASEAPATEAVPEAPATEPAPAGRPVPPGPVASAGWTPPEGGPAAVTVVATDTNRPVLGLQAGDFRLKVNGRDVAPRSVAGAGEAPARLAVAVDVSSTMAAALPAVRRLVGRLAARTHGAGGELLMARCGGEARLEEGWGADPGRLVSLMGEAGTAAAGPLAHLVTTALEGAEGGSGRTFLLVITDGGDTSSGEDWKRAEAAVAAAGVPVLAVGLRGRDFEARTQRMLTRFAEQSGGKSYVIREGDLLEMVMEHFTALVDGGYVLHFDRAGAGRDGLAKIRVEAVDKRLRVAHPRTVR